jgi:hypothetical protein
MAYQRRGGRRDRPPRAERPTGDRPERYDRGDRGFERRDRFEGGRDRFEGGRDRFEGGRDRFEGRDRGPRGPRFGGQPAPRGGEDAAMSLRLDPRRVQLLKEIAGESGMRPGELVLRWVQERIDAERARMLSGAPASAAPAGTGGPEASLGAELAMMAARLDDLTRRVDALVADTGDGAGAPTAAADASAAAAAEPATALAPAAGEREPTIAGDAGEPAVERLDGSAEGDAAETAPEGETPLAADAGEGAFGAEAVATAGSGPQEAEGEAVTPVEGEPPPRRRRGRPPKSTTAESTEAKPAARRRRRSATATPPAEANGHGRVPLHEEITAVLSERGPMSAADLAHAITERGRYVAQRSTKALDANAVNSRVSHPHYRARFVRQDGKIALAETAP